VHRTIGWPRPTSKARALIIGKRLLDSGAIVHDERTMLGNGFANWAALQHQHLSAIFAADRNIDIAAHQGTRRRREVDSIERERRIAEHINRSHGAGSDCGRHGPRSAGLQALLLDRSPQAEAVDDVITTLAQIPVRIAA